MDIDRIKKAYLIIANRMLGDDPASVAKKVEIVQWLEKEINCSFRNIEEFHSKLDKYLLKQETDGERLRMAREKAGLSKRVLASRLRVSTQFLSDMENNRRPLTTEAAEFLEKSSENGPKIASESP